MTDAKPLRSLDHVIVVTDDLNRSAEEWEALGFDLTLATHHPMGTGNRLAIFGSTFIELLGITRPEYLNEVGERLSTGFLKMRGGGGGSAIAFLSTDQDEDVADFSERGAPNIIAGHFERPVTLPDGRESAAVVDTVTTHHPDIGQIMLFTSHQKVSEAIWQPAWQQHPNGTVDMTQVVVQADAGAGAFERYASAILGPDAAREQNVLALGGNKRIVLRTVREIENEFGADAIIDAPLDPVIAGFVLQTETFERCAQQPGDAAVRVGPYLVVPPDRAGGVFLAFEERSAR